MFPSVPGERKSLDSSGIHLDCPHITRAEVLIPRWWLSHQTAVLTLFGGLDPSISLSLSIYRYVICIETVTHLCGRSCSKYFTLTDSFNLHGAPFEVSTLALPVLERGHESTE